MAEGVGFEPTEDTRSLTALAKRHHRPLGHPSGEEKSCVPQSIQTLLNSAMSRVRDAKGTKNPDDYAAWAERRLG